MAMALFVAMLSMSFTACSDDDDDDIPGIADYYIECKMSGGGYTSQEITSFESTLNSILSETTMKGYKKDEAIYVFDDVVRRLKKDVFVNGISDVTGTLQIVFYLKTTSGIVAKTATIKVTKNGCE